MSIVTIDIVERAGMFHRNGRQCIQCCYQREQSLSTQSAAANAVILNLER